MAYYNPGYWVDDPCDSLLTEIEHVVQLDKVAYPDIGAKKKGFLPPGAIELGVLVKESKTTLRLSGTISTVNKINFNLSLGDFILRQGHFNHKGHTNPAPIKRGISPPHHIHFPTIKYSDLTKRPAYAYKVRCNNNYIEALQKYCELNNISISGIRLPLIGRHS